MHYQKKEGVTAEHDGDVDEMFTAQIEYLQDLGELLQGSREVPIQNQGRQYLRQAERLRNEQKLFHAAQPAPKPKTVLPKGVTA